MTVPAPPSFPVGLEQLATAVMLLDGELSIQYLNPAAENLFELSLRTVRGQPLSQAFVETGGLVSAMEIALTEGVSFTEHELTLATLANRYRVNCIITPLAQPANALLLEFQPLDQHLKIAREERLYLQQEFNRELLRNLTHEIRNPLGGIRGAAQLLEHELPRAGLREYTQVIIKESDRLQSLMDRMLAPNRAPHFTMVNIHEVLERVRSIILAQRPVGVSIRRDYDLSLPELLADPEQLIQVVLNIARNAVQALEAAQIEGEIVFRTRVARRVHIGKRAFRLAMELKIIDNGPGIPEELREKIFYPLVSTKGDGSGLGLTIAQTFVAQHQGLIDCDSRPGRTCFTVLLPYVHPEQAH
ncbi:nitrogen regulation protein NR(II) [Thiobacter aerophilum]|uniref:histidine kinase n=1 Tax=Thiobacter aerophilum TaxID=3121275 RepID=A0ABV0EH70_9BURK